MLRKILTGFYYSFPLQLLFNNLKRNHVLMICWIILFAMITGSFGKYLGIPYLFLDPEYLNQVGPTSFFILGVVTAGFTIAFHITCYIMDGHRFSFVGALSRPFTRFSLNNSLIPLAFLITYIIEIVRFQVNNQYTSGNELMANLGGFLGGYLAMTLFLFAYFWFTNKDIFKYVVCRIDEKIKQNVQVTRASAMKKLDIAKKRQVRVDYYIGNNFKPVKVDDQSFYDRATVIQVFDQNHLNLVVIELMILLVVLILGIFKDVPAMQVPAAASCVIFLTMFVMLSGAFSYWFGEWAQTTALILFIGFNYLAGEGFFSKPYQAFGLNYDLAPVTYSVPVLREMNDTATIENDRASMARVLDNWRGRFPVDENPPMILLCVSGGGKRAALWALTALQTVDSVTSGALIKNTVLIAGASGGLIGASFFRELKLRQLNGEDVNPYSPDHRQSISSDNLNPLIFSLLANDLFVGLTQFHYNGRAYLRDRGYTFEDQLNLITENRMDKPLQAYYDAEQSGAIPVLILSPTIVNDGRKLYISAQPLSFMTSDAWTIEGYENTKISGVDFQKLFADHGGSQLRFLSALRMCATFPYITPNTNLPTLPPLEIMDAGISDNFGISDAMRFLFAMRTWVDAHTSGVIVVSIRDSPKLGSVGARGGETIVDNFTQPISSVYNNFENFQDITSDLLVSASAQWLDVKVHRVDFEYRAESYLPILQKMDSIRQTSARASLSWRLTAREKQGVITTMGSEENQKAIDDLRHLLGQ